MRKSRNKLLKDVEVIKQKRKELPRRNNSVTNLRYASSEPVPLKVQQQEFNQKRKVAIQKAQSRRNIMVSENYKQKLFHAHRKTIEGNIQVELRAIKLIRLWQEKRKARFLKQIWLKKIVFRLANAYLFKRQERLKDINKHLMVFRIQRFWTRFVQNYGMTFAIRRARTFCTTFKGVYNLNNAMGVTHKCSFILEDFLQNISCKIRINQAFIKWYKKVELIQNFVKESYAKKCQRFDVMANYWSLVNERLQWRMQTAHITERIFKRIKQHELTKLDRINEDDKTDIIKQYLR